MLNISSGATASHATRGSEGSQILKLLKAHKVLKTIKALLQYSGVNKWSFTVLSYATESIKSINLQQSIFISFFLFCSIVIAATLPDKWCCVYDFNSPQSSGLDCLLNVHRCGSNPSKLLMPCGNLCTTAAAAVQTLNCLFTLFCIFLFYFYYFTCCTSPRHVVVLHSKGAAISSIAMWLLPWRCIATIDCDIFNLCLWWLSVSGRRSHMSWNTAKREKQWIRREVDKRSSWYTRWIKLRWDEKGSAAHD